MHLGVSETAYHNWETNKTEPVIRMFPRIIEFLGYYPFSEPQMLGERILKYRRYNGISVKRLARKIGIDEGTLSRWEKGAIRPDNIIAQRLRKIMEFSYEFL